MPVIGMSRAVVVLVILTASAAHAETKMRANVNTNGGLFVELRDEDTGRTMATTLAPTRARDLAAYLSKHGISADTKDAPSTKPGCGFGDFFAGRC